jgi:hypothetical protein
MHCSFSASADVVRDNQLQHIDRNDTCHHNHPHVLVMHSIFSGILESGGAMNPLRLPRDSINAIFAGCLGTGQIGARQRTEKGLHYHKAGRGCAKRAQRRSNRCYVRGGRYFKRRYQEHRDRDQAILFSFVWKACNQRKENKRAQAWNRDEKLHARIHLCVRKLRDSRRKV